MNKPSAVLSLLLVGIGLALIPLQPAHSEQVVIDRTLWIQKVLIHLEQMSHESDARTKENDDLIRSSQNLLNRARAEGDAKTEETARRVLSKAQETKKKNEWSKARAEEGIARVRNLLAKMSGEDIPVQAVVKHISGDVLYITRDGKGSQLGNDRPYLEPGDTIVTRGNGRVEIQMLEGDGTVTVGPNSNFKVYGDDVLGETVDILEGKFRFIKAKIQKYARRFEVKTPNFIMSVQGTEFLVHVGPDETTEVVVLEGKLDVRPLKGDKTLPVEAGYKLSVPKQGAVAEPVPVDLGKIDRWWEGD